MPGPCAQHGEGDLGTDTCTPRCRRRRAGSLTYFLHVFVKAFALHQAPSSYQLLNGGHGGRRRGADAAERRPRQGAWRAISRLQPLLYKGGARAGRAEQPMRGGEEPGSQWEARTARSTPLPAPRAPSGLGSRGLRLQDARLRRGRRRARPHPARPTRARPPPPAPFGASARREAGRASRFTRAPPFRHPAAALFAFRTPQGMNEPSLGLGGSN